ncbi:MAG: diguanylate cyclase [Clostridia bacterium]|nr:diguanylate cyclase [Clostridia bacterium]
MKNSKFSYSTGAVLAITLLLLLLNIVVGGIVAIQSQNTMRQVINERMLGVAKTAGAMLDGDELASLKEEDVGGEKHNAILGKLRVFAENLDFKFIYVVRQAENGKFVFIADPDTEKPAEFGEEIVDSEALVSAGKGIEAVDSIAVSDEWGKYYTAYYPVKTSNGQIGGIIGVDFDAEWYEKQLTKNTVYILFASAISLIIGGSMIMLVTMKLKHKLDIINNETDLIYNDINTLLDEINVDSKNLVSDNKPVELPKSVTDDQGGIMRLADEVTIIKDALKKYIDVVHIKAYTDGMTGVGNKTAYLDLVQRINEGIPEGKEKFSIAVFDVDNLKIVNDEHGHVMGDNLINGTAKCIKNVFGAENVFRIGGDEFIAVLKDFSAKDMEEAFIRLDEEAKRANAALPEDAKVPIAFSKGAATFDPESDKSFKEVFRRADKVLYVDKNEHHKNG